MSFVFAIALMKCDVVVNHCCRLQVAFIFLAVVVSPINFLEITPVRLLGACFYFTDAT